MENFNFVNTTVGKKVLVAASGLFMFLFLLMHLAGNLEIYSGSDAMNAYGELLRVFPKGLWAFRLLLIVSVIVHIWATISLNLRNKKAKPSQYQKTTFLKTSLNSRYMILSGFTVFAFIIFHLVHYTFKLSHPEYSELIDEQGRHDIYSMVVMGFSSPLISSFYIVAQILLGFHISHGFSSAFRTLGFMNPDIYGKLRAFSNLLAFVIVLLFISIPLSVLLGLVK